MHFSSKVSIDLIPVELEHVSYQRSSYKEAKMLFSSKVSIDLSPAESEHVSCRRKGLTFGENNVVLPSGKYKLQLLAT